MEQVSAEYLSHLFGPFGNYNDLVKVGYKIQRGLYTYHVGFSFESYLTKSEL